MANNLLREYIRELLTETVHPNIERMIKRIKEEGHWVELHNDGTLIKNKDGFMIGYINWKTNVHAGECMGAQIVGNSSAKGGYGPLLYDIAIEATGGLTPDRGSVSDAARSVWEFYDNERSDVIKIQLDNPYNALTPSEEDNCAQFSAIQDAGPDDWQESSLSRVYKKTGTPVIDRLRKMGLIDTI